jgi:branched-chain amino acid transport system permease protein
VPARLADAFRRRRRIGLVAAVVLCAALAACAPGFMGLSWLRLLTTICMFAVIAESINLMAGFLGYPAFGNIVFFGLGAYGTAVAIDQFSWPPPAAIAAGLVLCAAVVLIIGPPLLRLRGHYFAIATLGLNEAAKAVVSNLTELTGGGKGLSLPIPTVSVEVTSRNYFWLFLALTVCSVGACAGMRVTRFGYACRAILANEEGAESLGINATLYKTSAWLISALLTGAAGGLYAQWVGYIDPPAVFDMTLAVKGFVMFLIGGAGTVVGPVVGAAVVELASNLAWRHLLKYHLAVLGVLIMTAALLIARRIPQRMAQYLQIGTDASGAKP